MDFQNSVKALAEKVQVLKPNLQTEEATKNSLIMPFIQLLGYDIFNPVEVIPEFTADLVGKKGEKVDYAIMQDNKPIIIVECKYWQEDLKLHNTQLQRYFHVTQARFGLLTNGIHFQFFTDLEAKNKMDKEPFLEFDFENIKENSITELKKFHKSAFDVDKIIDSASELKYSTAIRGILERELSDPSEDFVSFFVRQIYSGRLTKKTLEQFTEIVKKATNQSIRELVNERLHAALKKEEEQNHEPEPEEAESEIITTEEEIEAFHIVRSIVRQKIEASRIIARDTKTYFGVILDDNNRKPICRLHLNGTRKYIGLLDKDKNEERILLKSLDDIYLYSDQLIETALRYI